ncbi:arylamine N-acetyltransferase 1 [Mycena alexandri]|uniref:Arylamine N-acetyltransferase 1 n=1 Tax=Mycena alexandri TaxID=1745969 RepID=A0AAD6T7U5_9AGAR|nr:arylamine N-acetyltransferase 1 [Mycena alexandri]
MSYPLDPYAAAKLNKANAGAYLERIKLSSTLLDSPPSLSLLSTLLLAHLEQIPKDTSPLHVPEAQWNGPSTPIKLGTAFTNMPLGISSFDRIVHDNKGAFCFSINASFAGLLRYFGFVVSELVGRSFKSLGNDPSAHPDGWKWGTLTHQVLVAGWAGCADRYLIDGAWGPGNLAKPIKLTTNPEGETLIGLNEFEAYRLVYEQLPLSPNQTPPVDNIAGYTLYRRFAPIGTAHTLPITTASPGYWSPLFHTLLISVPLADYMLYHHFSASHELSAFTAFWLITRIIPGSGGARRSMMYAEKEGQGTRAKVYTTGGPEGRGSDEGRDVEWIDMETGPMKACLIKEFGFKF